MDLTESVVQGGVLIVHKLHEGKHLYEVENVVKYNKTSREKSFARKGDKLMQINDIDLQDLTPEELTQMLAKDSPKLTVHNSSEMKKPSVQAFAGDDIFYPVSKESMLLSFTMEMRREDDWQERGEGQEEGSGESPKSEEDFCLSEIEKNEERGDLLVVSMKTTRISVLKGRGGEDGSPCQDCTVKDVIVVAESSTVTLVSRGSESIRMEKSLNMAIQHVPSHYYLRGLCSQRVIYASPNPEKITIYYYKSNPVDKVFRGIPVVLNFTESNCFLRCCKEGDKVVLQIDTCEKERLKQISTADKSTLSFVFYMRSDRTGQKKFESAQHLNWFIQIIDTSSGSELVEMAKFDAEMEEKSFLFIIQK